MASSTGTGRSSTAITAIVIGATIILGAIAVTMLGSGNPLTGLQRVAESLYPPIAVTTQGAQIRDLYVIVFGIGAVIFFVVEGLILWAVLRYRRKPGDDALPPQTHGNNVAEIVWTVVPTLIVAFLFVVSWQTLNTVDAVSAQPDTKIRAVAGQFQWTFEYLPDDWDPVANRSEPLYTEYVPTGEDGGLSVPTGRTVQLYLDSPDVIHAFYVPQFLFKRDVVPGRTNAFEFDIEDGQAGQTFRGQCAELCGSGHAVMLFDVHAKTAADFDAWLAAKVAEANATPPPPPSGEPVPSGEPGAGTTLQVRAFNIAYEQTELTVPANTPFKIEFTNDDAGIPHNIEIKDVNGTSAFKGEIFNGVETRTYDVPALATGVYAFNCTVHTNMTGTITAN